MCEDGEDVGRRGGESRLHTNSPFCHNVQQLVADSQANVIYPLPRRRYWKDETRTDKRRISAGNGVYPTLQLPTSMHFRPKRCNLLVSVYKRLLCVGKRSRAQANVHARNVRIKVDI